MLLSVVHHALMSFNGGRNRTLIGIPIPSQPDFLRLLTYRITKAQYIALQQDCNNDQSACGHTCRISLAMSSKYLTNIQCTVKLFLVHRPTCPIFRRKLVNNWQFDVYLTYCKPKQVVHLKSLIDFIHLSYLQSTFNFIFGTLIQLFLIAVKI